MHALILCVGSAGDVHPFIAIGRALQRRGHDVELMTSPYFAERVERAGLRFAPFGDVADYERAVAAPDLWHPRRGLHALWREMAPRLAPAHDALASRLQPGRTVLVGSTLAWSVRLVQERLGVPAATVHLSPSTIVSAHRPAVLPGGTDVGWLPAPAVAVLLAAGERLVTDRIVGTELNRIRAALGLPPVRRVFGRWMHSPELVVCAWPEWFAPVARDWPASAVTVGFPRAESAQPLDDGLERFLQAGPAPIGFTPGSAMAHGRQFFERAIAASQALGRRALLITAYPQALPRALPAHAHHVRWAPFDRLLPRLAAFVHHGGIGTSADALAAGVPQLVTPFAHDQYDNAARLVRLGVAAAFPAAAPANRWIQALERLTSDAAIARACRRLAASMADDGDAAARAADALERLRPRH